MAWPRGLKRWIRKPTSKQQRKLDDATCYNTKVTSCLKWRQCQVRKYPYEDGRRVAGPSGPTTMDATRSLTWEHGALWVEDPKVLRLRTQSLLPMCQTLVSRVYPFSCRD
eukprot:6480407-Amphidinium_carterae.1